MGQALLRGLRAAGVPARRLLIVEANRATRQRVCRRYGVLASDLATVARQCDVLILAVKPQDMRPVLDGLRAAVQGGPERRPLVISIAAGLRIRAIERRLGRWPVVRVMPNLAATVGAAISTVDKGRWASASHLALARAIFRCVGEVIELPERLFDAVTAVSGSGPAYFFLIFQALRDAGVGQGLPNDVAQRLVVQTALGSAKVVDGSTEELEALIARVASKKGTTEAALRVFRRSRLTSILQAGVRAAAKRSKALTAFLSEDANKRE